MDISEVIPALSPGGAVSENLKSFEYRSQQGQMAEAVLAALCEDRILVVEAGTGTGKSLAYGLPMASWALEKGERIAISTGTINLQQQLVGKDLPLVAKVMGEDLDVVLVKGRNNYLCRRRLAEQLRQINLFEPGPELAMLPYIARWADETMDGSRSDLDEPVPESLWSTVCADTDACLGKKCPMYSDCFVRRARDAAGRADVLVVNHHLLFADLALRLELNEWERTAVLPPFERLVLDEAHGLEDAASAFFGNRVSRRGSLSILGSLFKGSKDSGKSKGVFLNLEREYRELGGQGENSRFMGKVMEIRKSVESAFDALVQFSQPFLDESLHGEKKLRLSMEFLSSPAWASVGEAFYAASSGLDDLAASMEEMLARLQSQSDETSASVEGRSGAKRLRKLVGSFRDLTGPPENSESKEVRWVEFGSNPSGRFVSLASAPLDLADKFNETLFNSMRTLVLTSATLTVRGSFEYQASRLGLDLLDDQKVSTLSLDSPFDFSSCSFLAVPADAPDPRDSRFETWLPEAIVQLLAASSGGALVLFTSWKLMRSSFEQCSERLESMGLEALCQGHAPRHKLLTRFRQQRSSVLFGTHSFWQGIDVAGDSLRLVIVTRLPFDVPTEPIMQARSERLASPFSQLSLPRAVLRLKQGFGRLIRTVTDRGAVVVLDSRLAKKSYGRVFIKSLPEIPILDSPLEDLCSYLSDFIQDSNKTA